MDSKLLLIFSRFIFSLRLNNKVPHSTLLHCLCFSGCKILSAVPTSASSIQVKWEQHPLATGYLLDTRRKNATDAAPIIIAVSAQVTDKTVQGLKPGTDYNVTLKVMNFFTVQCVTSVLVTTGK